MYQKLTHIMHICFGAIGVLILAIAVINYITVPLIATVITTSVGTYFILTSICYTVRLKYARTTRVVKILIVIKGVSIAAALVSLLILFGMSVYAYAALYL